MASKKSQVIEEIFKICTKCKNFEFHNDLVKEVSKKIVLGNPFDATKLDNKTKLPEILLKKDYAVIHLGSGKQYDTLKLWAYTFANPSDITTIKFIKSTAYKLINAN